MDDDKSTLAELLLQMKTSEHSIIKLLERIDNGGMEARNFEVLAKLQSAKMEIVKHYEAVKLMIERNYKNLKVDYDKKHEEMIVTGDSNLLAPKSGYGWNSIISTLGNNIDNSIKQKNEDKIAKEAQDTEFDEIDDDEDFELVKKKKPSNEVILPKGVKLNDKYR